MTTQILRTNKDVKNYVLRGLIYIRCAALNTYTSICHKENKPSKKSAPSEIKSKLTTSTI